VPHNIQELYGIPVKEIARLCKVSLKTASRWKDGQTVPPAAARMILAGDLGALCAEWSGWKFIKGKLISPEGWEFSVGDVLAIPFLHGQVRVYQGELRKMKEMSALQEQPAPGEWPEWSLQIAR
jgi:Phage protein